MSLRVLLATGLALLGGAVVMGALSVAYFLRQTGAGSPLRSRRGSAWSGVFAGLALVALGLALGRPDQAFVWVGWYLVLTVLAVGSATGASRRPR